MTKENCKKLYEMYLERGNKERAAAWLKKLENYDVDPNIKKTPTPTPAETPQTTTRSKKR